MEQMEPTVFLAVILEVRSRQLLVCNCSTRQTILVHTDQACCFSQGEQVLIQYSGAMTMSLPPQISAISITRNICC